MNPRTREVQIQTGALRGFLKLSGAYFWQERSARWMVLGLFVLTLLQILIQIRFNLWNRDFFNALENRDRDAFFWQMWLFLLLAIASMVTALTSVTW